MSERPAARPAHESADPSGTASRFTVLPRRITLEETVESRPAGRPADPDFGRNPDNDWLIRNGA